MLPSSRLHSREEPAKKSIRKWDTEADGGKSDEGETSKLGTTKDSATSHILQNSTGDEARSNILRSLAEMVEKLAKDSDDLTVTKKQTHFQQEIANKCKNLVPFGPFYGPGSDIIQQAKYAAWNHIVQRSSPGDERAYKLAVKDIADGAMEIYDIPDKDKPKPKEFLQMMIRDGCFFLQLAFHILGGGDHLGYPPGHPYFGKNKGSAAWLSDMFFVGNQIPYKVIRVLMKQTFFRDVIDNGIQSRTWYCPDEENIAKMALYLTVVKPAFWSHIQETPPPHFPEPPSDVLDCLRNLFLGNKAHQLKDSTSKEFERLETGSKDDNIKIPSAGELSKSGIKLASNKRFRLLPRSGKKVATNRRPGIKNIHFCDLVYCAKIYLPTLTIESHTKDILMNLVQYERGMNESERDVTAYLRFMRDLVRTHDDFKILEDKRIIEVKDPELKGTIIEMLEDLATLHNCKFTFAFRHIRQRITDYGGPPWRLISIILGIFTAVQTVFTVLAYVYPLKS